MSRYDVLVIGGGHNGLTAAALLAKSGRKVVVVERRDILGGLGAGEEFHPGYRSAGVFHDTSGIRPSVVAALDLERHGLELTDGPPSVFVPQQDGRGLLLHHDPARAADEIAAHSSVDAGRYREYREFLQRTVKVVGWLFDESLPASGESGSSFLQTAKRALAVRRLGKRHVAELLRIPPMCVADWLREWFETELLTCVLAGPALSGSFLGPWSPGSNATLLRVEMLAGRASQSGPQGLIDALAAAARSHGVDLRTGAEVRELRLGAGCVEGVTLTDGETIDAPIVAASCDPKTTFLKLVPASLLSTQLEHRVSSYRSAGTTAKVNLACSAPLRFSCRPDLAFEYARTGERLDDLERSFDALKYARFSQTPWLDIHVPSVSNPGLAPEGGHVVSILVHFAPYSLHGGWSDAERERLADAALDVLESYAPGIRSSVIAHEVLTPADLEERYGNCQGHLHHGEHGLDQLVSRPNPECAGFATPIKGLFLAGSGSYPGGGITCAPGAIAAATILG